ncbi:hypothetical protein BDF20DRAFT_843119 [Mycotypha africana]|uniref:uncharacterized protein n=1 Tax=Mycotypha africana TaxID=64632 RepID=UPI0023006068|nr:uncharacterized protein BDF20DRAFT_843119 [Mycotypha africana]KAI8991169.1 hypothetical protein BDF20DRAFT_843119 [Mycotypha africana]
MTDNFKSLIVKNLHSNVTEDSLKSVFTLISPVKSVKLAEHTNSKANSNCAVIDFYEHEGAEQVIHTMDKRTLNNQQISVQWNTINNNSHFEFQEQEASQQQQEQDQHEQQASEEEEDTSSLSSLDDLDYIEDVHKAHSRRASVTDHDNSNYVLLSNEPYERVFAQTPLYITSICVRNLPKNVIMHDIAPHFQQFGHVSDIHIKTLENEQKKAIVKMDTHANAATAICALQGITIGGKSAVLNWSTTEEEETINRKINNEHHLQHYYNNLNHQPVTSQLNAATRKKSAKSVIMEDSYLMNTTSMRPPAPAAPSTSSGADHKHAPGTQPSKEGLVHGWDQYYRQYYNASHISTAI